MLAWELAIPGAACIAQPDREGPSPGHVTQQDGQLVVCIVEALPLGWSRMGNRNEKKMTGSMNNVKNVTQL